MSDFLWPHVPVRLLCPWNSPGHSTGEGSLSLLQGIFPTQGLKPGFLHCKWILYCLSHQGSLRLLEWVTQEYWSETTREAPFYFYTDVYFLILKDLYRHQRRLVTRSFACMLPMMTEISSACLGMGYVCLSSILWEPCHKASYYLYEIGVGIIPFYRWGSCLIWLFFAYSRHVNFCLASFDYKRVRKLNTHSPRLLGS